MKMERKEKKTEILIYGISFLFYMVFAFAFPVFLDSDSVSYLSMSSTREPLYPIFLWVFRSIIHSDAYLRVVVVIQNLLMAFAVAKVSLYIQKTFYLKEGISLIFVGFHFLVAIMNQFIAGRAASYPNSIVTEGVTMAIWLLFMMHVMKAVLEDRTREVIFASIYAAVLLGIRKQMAITYLVIFAAVFFCFLGKKGFFKRIGFTALALVISLLLAMGGTKIYNYALRGEFSSSTRNMNLVLTTTLYICDEEDRELIPEEEVRILYDETYQTLDKIECNIDYAESGWSNLEKHYNECFDQITVGTTEKSFVEYAEKRGFASGMEAEQEADRMSALIVKSLLFDNLPKYAKVYGASFLNGMINTVARRNFLLDYYAAVIYIIYGVLLVLCIRKEETRALGLAALVILLAIVINVGVTAALIFCQPRYMIYNMAIFYCLGFSMFFAVIRKKHEPTK